MKMVSAAKYAKAERELKPARAYGEGAYGNLDSSTNRLRSVQLLTFQYLCVCLALPDKVELDVDEQKPNHLMVLLSSDRGLCGGVHSSLAKAAKAAIAELPSNVNTMLVPCGDKARAILQKSHGRLKDTHT